MGSAHRKRPGAKPEPRRRIRLDTDERRAQLVELGLAAFSERTYDEVSIEDVARTAGISKGLLYHYFPTKRDFYVACLRKAARELIERTLAADAEGPPLDRVGSAIDAYLDYVARRARAFTALFRGGIGSDPEVAAVVDETRSAFLKGLLEGVEGAPLLGALQVSPAVRLSLRGWIGFAEATSLEWVERQEVPQAEVRELLVGMLIATIQVSTAGAAQVAG